MSSWKPGLLAIRALPRCGRWARSAGRPCRQPVIPGRTACHYHGREGAPLNNSNARIHGRRSRAAELEKHERTVAARAARAAVRQAVARAKALL
jgi:hypothetical protein